MVKCDWGLIANTHTHTKKNSEVLPNLVAMNTHSSGSIGALRQGFNPLCLFDLLWGGSGESSPRSFSDRFPLVAFSSPAPLPLIWLLCPASVCIRRIVLSCLVKFEFKFLRWTRKCEI